jgi:hypothetical protein
VSVKATSGQPGLRTAAFSIGLDLTFAVTGLHASDPPAGFPRVRLTVGDVTDDDEGIERILEQRFPSGELGVAFDRLADGRLRLQTPPFGSYLFDGRNVTCAPPTDQPAWRWQRMFLGHVLPLAAVLSGRELLHSSGVVLRSGVGIGIVAPSTGGKTSLALHLVRLGAGFLTDDALALHRHDDRALSVWPGAGAASVRRAELEHLSRVGIELPGTVLGEDVDAARVVLPLAEAAPLGALYNVERGAPVDRVEIRQTAPDPVRLLGSTFNLVLRSPERLRRQLEVCAEMAREAKHYSVRAPATTSAAELAEALYEHADVALAA